VGWVQNLAAIISEMISRARKQTAPNASFDEHFLNQRDVILMWIESFDNALVGYTWHQNNNVQVWKETKEKENKN
jgi:hypothetical protein